jgi:hypothetical protein
MGRNVFPTRLFNPASLRVRLEGAALDGGRSLAGESQFADLSGGGRWVADFGETNLWRREKVLAWRRVAGAADGGAGLFLVPLADRRHQPLTNPLSTPDAFGLSTWVDDETDWAPDQVTAEVTADAALGATELAFDYTGPLPLVGGEHFSILHPSWSWRLYRVQRVKSGGLGSGDATVIDFRPPLREAVTAGESPGTFLNFDSPRCLMRAVGDIEPTIELLRFGKAQAAFEEAGKPPVESES